MTKVRSPASRRRMIRSTAAARGTRSKPTPSTSTRADTTLADGDEASAEEVDVLEREAGALRDAIKRVLGDVTRDAGDLRQQLVHIAKKRPATRKHHALVDDVGRQLRWRLLENGLDGSDDLLQ